MSKHHSRGQFITFEGAEGSGKSTQAAFAGDYLRSRGRDVVLLREPGGTAIGEAVRGILLNVKHAGMTSECEVLLYMAARSQLVEKVVAPALRLGKIVLCDRFLDSTLAYQGYGNGMDLDRIRQIGAFVTRGVVPDLTLLFDIAAEKGLARIGKHKDRIESRSLAYHRRVRRGYQDLARREPERFRMITVDRGMEDIAVIVRKHLDSFLNLQPSTGS